MRVLKGQPARSLPPQIAKEPPAVETLHNLLQQSPSSGESRSALPKHLRSSLKRADRLVKGRNHTRKGVGSTLNPILDTSTVGKSVGGKYIRKGVSVKGMERILVRQGSTK